MYALLIWNKTPPYDHIAKASLKGYGISPAVFSTHRRKRVVGCFPGKEFVDLS